MAAQEQDDPPPRWRIDELAHATGITARNIRAYQSRGLLPGPEVEGRTGFYGPRHVERLTLIRGLQERGFNLGAIQQLLEAAPDGGDEPLEVLRAAADSFAPEQPEIVSLSQAAQQWGDDGPRVLERAIALGLARTLDGHRIEYPSPRMIRAAQQMMAIGMPIDRLLDITERIREHADGIAALYAEVFLEQIWEPFRRAGSPPERWAEIRGTLTQLGLLGTEVLQAVFAGAMAAAIEQTLSSRNPRAGRPGEDDAQPGGAHT